MSLDPALVAMLVALAAVWGLILAAYRRVLVELWREPVLAQPVLIIESDDWGPGPASHGQRLAALAKTLSGYRDSQGRHPVMTLGVVMALPDTAAMRQTHRASYIRLTLANPRCRPVVEAMRQGCAAGVFAVQLHGREHYWPSTVMALAERDAVLRDWLTGDDFPATEALPAPLQSRWIDSRTLPSTPLPVPEIEAAVAEEVAEFERVFGKAPVVAVPNTFIWTQAVEDAWLQHGVEIIVTPGRRYTGRDAAGKPAFVDKCIRNGQRTAGSAIYLVRDGYFEPALGHSVAQGLAAVARRSRLGRPALLETHRFNFIGEETTFRRHLKTLDGLLAEALRLWPELRFMSTEELGRTYRDPASPLLESRMAARIHIWLRRLQAIGRLRKLAWLCGLIIPAAVLLWFTALLAPIGDSMQRMERTA